MSDIRAAAERYRIARANPTRPEQWMHAGEPFGDVEAIEAAYVLADAYLASHPADGDEPVTEEWLLAVGGQKIPFESCEGEGYFIGWEDDTGEIRLRLEDFGEGVWQASFENWDLWPDDIRVRQQVRDLCRALGIELKEQP